MYSARRSRGEGGALEGNALNREDLTRYTGGNVLAWELVKGGHGTGFPFLFGVMETIQWTCAWLYESSWAC